MRVLVTGAGGQLGRDLARALAMHDALLLEHARLELTDRDAVVAAITAARPDAVIHAASWTDVDACELDPDRARLINTDAARTVAAAAAAAGAFAITVSTDYVFDGRGERAYVETDPVGPLQVYGRTKLDGEAGDAVVRTAWLYGAARGDGRPSRNFVRWVLSAQGPLKVVTDQVGSPTPTRDLAVALVALCEARAPGLFHVTCAGASSRYDLAREVLARSGGDPARVEACTTADLPARPAARPAFAPLDGPAWRDAGFAPLLPWDEALARALREDDWDAGG